MLSRILLLGLALAAAFLAALAWGWGGRRGSLARERCLVCHTQASDDPGGAHAASRVGCLACHLGDGQATDKEAAHAGLEREPGALATVGRTCGRCHPAETARVGMSLMATARGLIGVDRWVFGELPSPDSSETMSALLAVEHPTRAQDHLRKLCAGCHLGTRRDNRDSAVPVGGSGCSACHSSGARRPQGHTPVDAQVPSDRCYGCHSRSARISLSYQGLAEESGGPEALPDGRRARRVSPDVHQAAGMACTDCHLHTELMGDGQVWRHQEQQVEISCAACHPPADSRPRQTWAGVRDPITQTMLRLRGQTRPPAEAVATGRRGTPLWSLRPSPDGSWVLQRKADLQPLTARPMPVDASHRMPGHERLTCTACHAAWAPRCDSCHTSYQAGGEQWDFAAGRLAHGAWVEADSSPSWGPPTLGVDGTGKIAPAVPGMILEVQDGAKSIRRRLFANLDPHTTTRAGRSCEDCHRSPLALGLGQGRLDFGPGGVTFRPLKGGDGWTSLFPATPGQGTRRGARSLDAAEQRRILQVGTCLPCHPQAADPIYGAFRQSRQRQRKSRCRG